MNSLSNLCCSSCSDPGALRVPHELHPDGHRRAVHKDPCCDLQGRQAAGAHRAGTAASTQGQAQAAQAAQHAGTGRAAGQQAPVCAPCPACCCCPACLPPCVSAAVLCCAAPAAGSLLPCPACCPPAAAACAAVPCPVLCPEVVRAAHPEVIQVHPRHLGYFRGRAEDQQLPAARGERWFFHRRGQFRRADGFLDVRGTSFIVCTPSIDIDCLP